MGGALVDLGVTGAEAPVTYVSALLVPLHPILPLPTTKTLNAPWLVLILFFSLSLSLCVCVCVCVCLC